MEFAFNEDQRELRAILAGFLERHAGSAVVREAAFDGDGFAREPWRRMIEEMELTGLEIELEQGGSGATFVEVGIALEELGRSLLPVPFLPTVVAAAVLGRAGVEDGAEEPVGDALRRIAEGAVATLALAEPGSLQASHEGNGVRIDGSVDRVVDAGHAELIVCAAELDGEPTPLLVERGAAGVEVEAGMTLDQTRRQGMLRLAGAPATPLGGPGRGTAALERARDLEGVALALEAVGAAARCLEITVEYLKERVQFGKPIGSFQALKHRCADLVSELEAARSTAYYASWVVDAAPEELPVVGPLARAVCNDAFLHVAAESIQLHGGIGFTWEHDAHLYFKRAKSTDLLGGGSRAQRRLVGERAGMVGTAR
jgi:alkylation response protein AidB-like acyl-CoA dehydrogenase